MPLPIFTSTAQIQPGPIASTAGVFDKLADTFGKAVTATAAKAGVEAGQRLGFKTVPLAITPATEAFNKAGLEANRFSAAADVTQHTNELLNEFGTNVNGSESLQEYQQAFTAYSKNLLDTIPIENRAVINNILTNKGIRGAAAISKKLQKQSNFEGLKLFYNNDTILGNEISNAARQPDKANQQSALGYYGVRVQQINQAVKSGLIDAKSGVGMLQRARLSINQNGFLGQYLAQPINKRAEFLQKTQNSKAYDGEFSATQKATQINKAGNLQRTLDRVDGVTNLDLEEQFNDMGKQALNGVPINESERTSWLAAHPLRADDLNNHIDTNAWVGSTIRKNQYEPIANVMGSIDELRKPLPAKELEKPGASRLLEARTKVANGLTKHLTELFKDPALVTSQDPAVQKQQATWNNENPFRPSQETKLQYDAKQMQFHYGLLDKTMQGYGLAAGKRNLLTNAQSKGLIDNININGFEAGINTLAGIRKAAGPMWGGIQQSLHKQGMRYGTTVAIGMTGYPTGESNINQIKEAEELTPKEVDNLIPKDQQAAIIADLQASPQFISYFNSRSKVPTNDLKDQSKLINLMEKVAYVKYIKGDAQGLGKGDPQEAAEASLENLVLGRYDSVNNDYVVPLGEDSGAVRAGLNQQDALAKENKIAFFVPKTGIKGLPLTQAAIDNYKDNISKRTWVNNSMNQMELMAVGINGKPIPLKNGKNWTQNIADMSTNAAFLSAAQSARTAKARLKKIKIITPALNVILPPLAPILQAFELLQDEQ